ncbi:hypothetical protein [Parasediminibacterium sp. JCM 36343]|uniref:hypothetical protein n=1 Tax=Parasediminibacterium sp. JCM 36343 TaxID=3374279 RepID=UPI00397CB85D
MSVEILADEIVVRIPKSEYNSDVQRLIDAVEAPKKESKYFFDVEEGSEMEELLLQVKKERRPYTNELLKQAGIEHK